MHEVTFCQCGKQVQIAQDQYALGNDANRMLGLQRKL